MSEKLGGSYPGSNEHFGENIPEGEHKHEVTPGKHPSVKFNLEQDPLHVEGIDPEPDLVEEMRLTPKGEDMHRFSGGILLVIAIILILLIGFGLISGFMG